MSGHFEYGKWVDDKNSKLKASDELDDLLDRDASGDTWDPDRQSRQYGGNGYSQKQPECKHVGDVLRGIPRLWGSSHRGGWSKGMTLKVVLTSEAFDALPEGGSSVYYWPIPDMWTPPANEDSIKRLLHLHEMHKSGHTVEVACFGGHGRTGMVLAILAALDQGWNPKEAVSKLREAYCKRAVESAAQEWFVEAAIVACRSMLAGQQAEMPALPAPALAEREGHDDERKHTSVDRSQKIGGFAGLRERNEHIRDLRRLGMSLADIADETGLSPNRVSEILNAIRV